MCVCACVFDREREGKKKEEKITHTIKTPERFVCIGNTSGVFQSRPSLLAQPLIRLSAFKPSLGEDKIEFARETKMEKEKGEGKRPVPVCVHSPKPGQVLGSLEAVAGKTVFFSVAPYSCIMAPLPMGLNGLVRYCARQKITDS